MIPLLALVVVASANPERHLTRHGERLRLDTYTTIDGDGPAFARWRRRSGTIRAWAFRDRQVERYTRYEGRQPAQTTWFNAGGVRIAMADWADGKPATYDLVLPDVEPIDLTDWGPVDVHGLWVHAPPTTTPNAWAFGEGTVVGLRMDEADATTAAFAVELAQGCGCEILDRQPFWIDGRAGVRFSAHLPDADTPHRAEVWTVPAQDGLIALVARWPASDPSAQERLRAMVSLATWESP